LDDEIYSGLQLFAKKVAEGLKKAIVCERVGVLVLGLEVPHAHIHLIPMKNETDVLNFSNKKKFTPEVPHAHIHLIPMKNETDVLNFSNKKKFTTEEFEAIREIISSNILL